MHTETPCQHDTRPHHTTATRNFCSPGDVYRDEDTSVTLERTTLRESGKSLLPPLVGDDSNAYHLLMTQRASSSDQPIDVAALQIVTYPDPVLRQKAQPITRIDDQVRRVAKRMLELMHEAPGIGLAAPQVGLPWRMFVANATGEPEDDMVFINPVLQVVGRKTADYEEGCLSLPGIRAEIRRPVAIRIRAYDLEGNAFEATSDDLPARIWQHENDHLDGVLIIDRMTPFDRDANKRLLAELEAEADQ